MKYLYFFVALSIVAGVTHGLYEISGVTPKVSWGVCDNNGTCSATTPNSYCDLQEKQQCGEGVCACVTDYVSVPDPDNADKIICIPAAHNVDDNCTHDAQCQYSLGDLSICHIPDGKVSGTCQCSADTVFCEGDTTVPKQCRNPSKLGEACDRCDSQCPNDAICKEIGGLSDVYRCQCNTSFTESNEISGCVKTASKIGEKCDIHPRQCEGVKESICGPDKTCVCNSASHIESANNSSCLPTREHLEMECIENEQCLPENTSCQRYFQEPKRCYCKENYTESSEFPNTCVLHHRYGEECTNNLECTNVLGKNSECSSKDDMICLCKPGFVGGGFVDGYGYCLPTVKLGEACPLYYRQCVDANGSSSMTSCDNKMCKCNLSSKEHDGMCYGRTGVNDLCDSDVHCSLWVSGPVFCTLRDPEGDTKTCKCDDGYKASAGGNQCLIDE